MDYPCWDEWVEIYYREVRGNKLGSFVKKLAFSVCVYALWREREREIIEFLGRS